MKKGCYHRYFEECSIVSEEEKADRKIGSVIEKMILFFEGNTREINHFLKVYALAKTIGEQEGLDVATQEILEIAAIVHDIACPLCKEKYGYAGGKEQEREGSLLAKRFLEELRYDSTVIERVCYLVAHHHTYDNVEGLDYQILLEADFLVNIGEGHVKRVAAKSIFRTKTGIRLLESMYPQSNNFGILA